MVVAPSLTVTEPVGVPAPPVTVTLIELAVPKVEGSGTCTAATVDGASTLAGGHLDVVDPPAVDAATTVATDCEPDLDGVTRATPRLA